MRLLIKRAQPFADEPLVAVGNFTWLGNSMGAQPGVRGREDLAGGLPDWTLIGAGAQRLHVVTSSAINPDRGEALFGSWPLALVRLTEETFERKIGPVQAGSYRAVRFEFPDRPAAVLQPFGGAAFELIDIQQRARPHVPPRPDGLTQVALMTTADGPVSDDVFFVLSYTDGRTDTVPLGENDRLLTELQALPGFDNETFVKAMGGSDVGISVLWRAAG
jgi:hypothetical protein